MRERPDRRYNGGVKTLRYVLCDVFAERPLRGQPLAVFTDARGLDAATLQGLARELNLSEAAFVLPPRRGGQAQLRIFSPTRELAVAGHGVLGAAIVLGSPLQAFELRLELGDGIVPVHLEHEGPRVSFAWMAPPPPRPYVVENVAAIHRALGQPELDAPIEGFDDGRRHVCVSLPTRRALAELAPDMAALAAAAPAGVYAFHFDGQCCHGRHLAGATGREEAAAAGAAAGSVALLLRQRGLLGPGAVLRIEQGEESGRPATVYARLGDGKPGAPLVELGGTACVVARGQFSI